MVSIHSMLAVVPSVFLSMLPLSNPQAATPCDLGITSGRIGGVPQGWSVPTPGWVAEVRDSAAGDGQLYTVLALRGESPAPFGNLMRMVDAREYQGRDVTFSAKIRVEAEEEGARAQMWLRVDRPDQQTGAFDNMHDRPIFAGGWTEAKIALSIDRDAEQLALGFMSLGGAVLYIDEVTLESSGEASYQEPSPPQVLSERGRENVAAAARLLSYLRYFHPSDQALAVEAWEHLAIHAIEQAEPAQNAADLAQSLLESFRPIAPSLQLWPGDAQDAPAVFPAPSSALGVTYYRHMGAGLIAAEGRPNVYSTEVVREARGALSNGVAQACFRDKALGNSGVWCRLPIELYYDAEGTLPHARTPEEWTSIENKPKLTALNRSTRLAGVALCFGVMQHFYPYFDVVETDWNTALDEALSQAAQAADETSYLGVLSEFVAKLHDGHGHVWKWGLAPESMIPLALAWAGNELVVVGKHESVASNVRIGDVILSIDGKTSSTCYAEVIPGISAATDGWRRSRALQSLLFQLHTADPVRLQLRHPDGAEYEVACARIPPTEIEDVTAKKPRYGAELVPGILYFDLNGTPANTLETLMPALSDAAGIVFDLRGYPNSAAFELVKHLIDGEATSASWNIPIVTLPDQEGWSWDVSGWELEPQSPHLNASIAFLTDGSAISYAESIMGIVEAYALGEIVGAPTAGTNGNVNPFELPGGYTVSWTGMKVIKHDGSQHHGVGILPTVPVVPTAQGIADGRDEVLEKAVDVLVAKIAKEGR